MIAAFIFFFAGFLLSALFSGMEMAFVSCNKLKVRHRSESGDRSAGIIDQLQRRPKRVLASVLLYTNLGNVSLTAAFVYVLKTQFQVTNIWLEALILLPIIIVFAEMVPKEYCRQRANELIFSVSRWLQWSTRLSARLVEDIIGITDRIIQLFAPVQTKKSPFVTRSELRAVIDESAKRGVVMDHEKRLIDRIFEFEHRSVDEMMQPLGVVNKISLTASIKQLKSMARKSRRNSFWALAYDRQATNIVGVIHVFDVLFEEDEAQSIQPFIRTPLFVRGSASNEDAFLTLQSKRQSLAVVLDKQDRAIGVITVPNLIQF